MKYFIFKSYNSHPIYGYGTFKDAKRYMAYLNANRRTDLYALGRVPDSVPINGIEFDLRDELDELFR